MTKAFEARGGGAKGGVEIGRDGVTTIPVSFAEKFTASQQFDAIFKEGMALVESTAAYLDGAGRKDAKSLKPAIAMAYATESMRLTTRLLELASWLLVRRALKDGDITREEALAKHRRMKLETIGRPSHVKLFDDLPKKLRVLIKSSFSLQDRIIKLDQAFKTDQEFIPDTTAPAVNPVGASVARIAAAFGG
jgi:regulator of CtrA degradation